MADVCVQAKALNDLFYVITWNCIALYSFPLYLRNEWILADVIRSTGTHPPTQHHIPEDQFLQIGVGCRGMSRGWKGNVERGGGAELDIRSNT